MKTITNYIIIIIIIIIIRTAFIAVVKSTVWESFFEVTVARKRSWVT